MFNDHKTIRVCSTCAEAGKRKATPVEGAGAGPSKRPKKAKGGSENFSVLVRGRTATRSLKFSSLSQRCEDDGYLVVCFACDALPVALVLVCLFLFFSCNTEAGAPGRHESFVTT